MYCGFNAKVKIWLLKVLVSVLHKDTCLSVLCTQKKEERKQKEKEETKEIYRVAMNHVGQHSLISDSIHMPGM